jgi:hypothetical protein
METEVRRQAEYVALRATIRQRGTARMVMVPIIFTAWAATAIATSAVITVAISTLVPLIVLAAGFEATLALYLNVERIGRYLQVFHEPSNGALEAGRWEHVTMEFGRRFPGGGVDPLFGRLFMLATSVNFLPVALGGIPLEIGVIAVVHFLFISRVRLGQRAGRIQRVADLEHFQALARPEV